MAESEQSNIVQAIRDLKSREPYSPFAIVLASGDRYVIKAGENLVEMKSEFFYAYPHSDQFVFMRLNQIVAVEKLAEKRPARRKAS